MYISLSLSKILEKKLLTRHDRYNSKEKGKSIWFSKETWRCRTVLQISK